MKGAIKRLLRKEKKYSKKKMKMSSFLKESTSFIMERVIITFLFIRDLTRRYDELRVCHNCHTISESKIISPKTSSGFEFLAVCTTKFM